MTEAMKRISKCVVYRAMSRLTFYRGTEEGKEE